MRPILYPWDMCEIVCTIYYLKSFANRDLSISSNFLILITLKSPLKLIQMSSSTKLKQIQEINVKTVQKCV